MIIRRSGLTKTPKRKPPSEDYYGPPPEGFEDNFVPMFGYLTSVTVALDKPAPWADSFPNVREGRFGPARQAIGWIICYPTFTLYVSSPV